MNLNKDEIDNYIWTKRWLKVPYKKSDFLFKKELKEDKETQKKKLREDMDRINNHIIEGNLFDEYKAHAKYVYYADFPKMSEKKKILLYRKQCNQIFEIWDKRVKENV
jgi:hypothetical protein